MEAYNYQWVSQDAYYNQQYNYTPNDHHPSWQNHPTYPWSYNNHDHFYAPSYSYPPPQPLVQKSNLEELVDKYLERTEMRMDSQVVDAPISSYSSEFAYQPPPQQEEMSNLEDLLTKFMTSTEARMNNQDKLFSQFEAEMESQATSLRNLEIQIEQLANAVINYPQDTLPSDTKSDSKEEGKELCEADTLESDKEFQEVIGEKLKRSYPNEEGDCEVGHKRSIIEEEEEKDEDDQALGLNDVKQTSAVPPVLFTKKFQMREEYYQVYIIEEKLNDMDEFKFGGDHQLCKKAMRIKENTTRRHEMTIFAYEPD